MLPPGTRWALLGGGFLLALLLGTGGWYWLERRTEVGQAAFDQAFFLYRQAMAEESPERTAQATEALQRFVRDHSRHPAAPAAHYALGNLHYRAKAYDQAVASFERATRTGRGSLLGMSQLGLGYAWEAQGNAEQALAIYQDALKGRDAQDSLYGELLLAVARTQVALKRPADARATYQRFLNDLPASPETGLVKARLASLEGTATP